MIRAAKEAINNIDPVDVKARYRLEQGYTFELNLAGVADDRLAAIAAATSPDCRCLSGSSSQVAAVSSKCFASPSCR